LAAEIGVGEKVELPELRLQWGRRLLAAEIVCRAGERRPNASLQWGRRLLAAEIRARDTGLHFALLQLQWGRRLLAAEINDWFVYLEGGNVLQWGRRLLAAEIVASYTTALFSHAASMGPPLVGGGNRDSDRACSVLMRRASMGPPLVGGGNTTTDFVDALAHELQWGRRLLAAEICWTRFRPILPRWRFNGAAACWRRKSRAGRELRDGILPLQWGRRLLAAEIAATGGAIPAA